MLLQAMALERVGLCKRRPSDIEQSSWQATDRGDPASCRSIRSRAFAVSSTSPRCNRPSLDRRDLQSISLKIHRIAQLDYFGYGGLRWLIIALLKLARIMDWQGSVLTSFYFWSPYWTILMARLRYFDGKIEIFWWRDWDISIARLRCFTQVLYDRWLPKYVKINCIIYIIDMRFTVI